MDSLITNTLQPEGWIAYLQMVELIKCVYKTKYSKYKSIKNVWECVTDDFKVPNI